MRRDGLMKSVFAGNIDSTERFFQVQWGVAQKLPVFSVVTDPGSALRVKTDWAGDARPGSATENYSGRLCYGRLCYILGFLSTIYKQM